MDRKSSFALLLVLTVFDIFIVYLFAVNFGQTQSIPIDGSFKTKDNPSNNPLQALRKIETRRFHSKGHRLKQLEKVVSVAMKNVVEKEKRNGENLGKGVEKENFTKSRGNNKHKVKNGVKNDKEKNDEGGGKHGNVQFKGKPKVENYLIYLCDRKKKCSGFADRQKSIVGLYGLSLVTNRTFGLIMSVPANLSDFYRPNRVNWSVNVTALAGKTSVELDCMPRNHTCKFDIVNSLAQVEVIYVRSRYDFFLGDLRHRTYLPSWVRGSVASVFAHSWAHLMTPTETLRRGVNDILKKIARDMRQDAYLIPKLSSGPCKTACGKILHLRKTEIPSIDKIKCLRTLPAYNRSISKQERATYLRHVCPVHTALTPPRDDVIDAAEGYQYVDLKLVCVQIRIGRSPTIANDPVFNKVEDLESVWRVVRPYITQGRHVFLATDSQEVRVLAKSLFGSRVHVNSDPIVHVNLVSKDQDAWSGMRFALMEQLFLATSCPVLIYTRSGFGLKAACLRTLGKQAGQETFVLQHGIVTRRNV